MTLADTIPRAWWLFRTSPMSRVYVPADTEAEARSALTANSYRGAPVHEWPCHEPGTMSRVGGSESKPLQRSADPIECVLLERDGKRTVYRVSRKVVIG